MAKLAVVINELPTEDCFYITKNKKKETRCKRMIAASVAHSSAEVTIISFSSRDNCSPKKVVFPFYEIYLDKIWIST